MYCRAQEDLDRIAMLRYRSWAERIGHPYLWYISKGDLVRAHSSVRDSWFLPTREELQSAHQLVPGGIQLPDISPTRYTTMLHWGNCAVVGKT